MNKVPFTFVSHSGFDEVFEEAMFFTSTVPAGVPSLFHSSAPLTPSSPAKKRVPFTFVSHPTPMLASCTVPASVPSVFQSSPPKKVVKNTVPSTSVSCVGFELPEPGTMSLIRTVPAGVPSLFQSSIPLAALNALKKSVPFETVRSSGFELDRPGFTSIRTVPALVPSLTHSSFCTPSSALNIALPFTLATSKT